jgi:hypothetical protein
MDTKICVEDARGKLNFHGILHDPLGFNFHVRLFLEVLSTRKRCKGV